MFAGHPNLALHHHGIDTATFDPPTEDPYEANSEGRAVFVGAAYLDTEFLTIAAQELPRWEFHVIGPLGHVPDGPNMVAHGKLPFAGTVPYIAHADVGLACLRYLRGAESFTDSLKVIQYTHARLPIVAPEFMRSARNNVFTYRPGDRESIRAALLAARAFDRSTVDRSGIGSSDRPGQMPRWAGTLAVNSKPPRSAVVQDSFLAPGGSEKSRSSLPTSLPGVRK